MCVLYLARWAVVRKQGRRVKKALTLGFVGTEGGTLLG